MGRVGLCAGFVFLWQIQLDNDGGIGYAEDMKNNPDLEQELLRHMHSGEETLLEDLAAKLTEGGRKVAHGKIVAALKALATSGAGRFIVGRKGKASRFLRAEGNGGRRAAAASGPARKTRAARKGRADAVPGVLEQVFTLRPGCMVRVQIPDDLTLDEARRIGRVLEVLAGGAD